MKNIMVTKGLRGKENPEAYHEKCLAAVKAHYAALGEEINITESTGVSNQFDGSPIGIEGATINRRVRGLGNVIMEELAIADELVLMDDWQNYDGCRSEHFIAAQYGVKCVYLNS